MTNEVHKLTPFNEAVKHWKPAKGPKRPSAGVLKGVLRAMMAESYIRWNGDRQQGWFDLSALAASSGFKKRVVSDAVKALEADGWLVQVGTHVQMTAKGQRAERKVWQFTIPAMHTVHPDVQDMHSGMQDMHPDVHMVQSAMHDVHTNTDIHTTTTTDSETESDTEATDERSEVHATNEVDMNSDKTFMQIAEAEFADVYAAFEADLAVEPHTRLHGPEVEVEHTLNSVNPSAATEAESAGEPIEDDAPEVDWDAAAEALVAEAQPVDLSEMQLSASCPKRFNGKHARVEYVDSVKCAACHERAVMPALV